jgi:PucR family transcriptional regulator, purine catabolism regulatory protein
MTMTVRRLAQHPGLGLRLVAGRENADRTIAWAHSIELADPTPYLSGGELVMTTGMNVGRTDRDHFDYLARLSAAGVAALAFDTGTTFTHVPPGIITAGNQLGLPILAVPADTPFIAITRAVIDEVTAGQLRSVQRVVDQQEVMAREALSNGVPAVVGALSTALSSAVVVLATDGSTLAAAGPDTGRIAQLCSQQIHGTRTRTHRHQASQVLADGDGYCTLQALRATQTLRGYLAVRSEDPLSPLDRLLVAHAVSLITIEMAKPAKVLDAEHLLRAAVTGALLTGPTHVDAGLLRYFSFDPANLATVTVLTNTGPAIAAEKQAHHILDTSASPYLMRTHANEIDLVLPADTGVASEAIRLALGAQLQRRVGGGISQPGALDNLALCLRQARAAARAHTGHGRICEYAELGVFNILLGNRSTADLELMSRQLKALDDHDSDDGSATSGLLATLEAYLHENGHVESAAAAIGIHRHTMRNRLAKIRELTGCNLESADSRAEMWLAIKARELLAIGAD